MSFLDMIFTSKEKSEVERLQEERDELVQIICKLVDKYGVKTPAWEEARKVKEYYIGNNVRIDWQPEADPSNEVLGEK